MAEVRRVTLTYNNVYAVIGGDGWVLIDTGPDYRGAFEGLRAGLGDIRPSLVVATHGHVDHAGLGRDWQEAGVPVAVGRADAHLCERSALGEAAEFAGLRAFVDATGAP